MALSGKHWPKSQEKTPGPLQPEGPGFPVVGSRPSHPCSSLLSGDKKMFEKKRFRSMAEVEEEIGAKGREIESR
jgi:hypothetical protein